MSTMLKQISDAMLAALNTGRPAGVPAATFWTGLPVNPATLPHRTLGWHNEAVEQVGSTEGPLVRRTVQFAVEDIVGASTTTSALAAAEPLRAWSIKALVGNRFVVSGTPLAIRSGELGTQWVLEQAEVPFARVVHQFEVTFTTRANDAELRA
jgi:hypothetical protein